MLKVGCHLSIAKGYFSAANEALSIGANTFQFFTRNPRGGSVKAVDLDDVAAFNKLISSKSIVTPLAHAPYTINACAIDQSLRDFAKNTMADDLSRLESVEGAMYNFHPGSHVKQGANVGISLIADMLNAVLQPFQRTTVLLETMSGKGSEVGRSFDEIRAIIDMVTLGDSLGVCLDTCHVFDAGYDIINDLDGVLTSFDKLVGLKRLRAIHVNGSLNMLGSHKDRHARLGEGNIPIEALGRIINHPALKNIPLYLETPNELDGYEREIALLKALYEGE